MRLSRRGRKKKRAAKKRVKKGRSKIFPSLEGVGPGEETALLVGLGNPGRKYSKTRHNAGFMAADAVIGKSEVLSEREWSEGYLAAARWEGKEFLVLKPGTYMNVSGRAVAPVLDYYGLDRGRMVILHDDIDIPLGDIRVKRGGGTAGHLGLRSVVEAVGGPDFMRVRIGVGRPQSGADPARYVLEQFVAEEKEAAWVSVHRAAEQALDLMAEMSRDEQ